MKRTCQHGRGFSLVELIVAMAILAIVGLLLFSVVNNTSMIISHASSELDANRVARECLDLIGQDLSLIRLPYGTGVGNTALPPANDAGLQLSVAPASVGSRYRYPQAFFWQAALARNKRYGDLAVVGYFVLRDLSDPDHKRLQLRRLFVEPDDPSLPAASSEYLIYRTPADWYPDSLLAKFAPDTAAADNTNGQRGWVADGVLALWVRCLDPKGNAIIANAGSGLMRNTFDSRQSYIYSDLSNTGSGNTTVYPSGKKDAAKGIYPFAGIPATIEVAIVCVAPRDIANITTLDPPTVSTSPDAKQFYNTINAYVASVRQKNPRARTVESFVRKYSLYPNP